jgi:hypothetical protein
MAKPKSKLRGRIDFGNLASVAVLRPLPALMTSIMVAGSRPALTPNTTTSELAATAVADSRLLQSFMVWPIPGRSPMWNTLPMCFSIGSSSV